MALEKRPALGRKLRRISAGLKNDNARALYSAFECRGFVILFEPVMEAL